MRVLEALGIVGLMTAAFLGGTAVHEATHAVAVWLVGGRIDHVHWLPPNAAVVFEAPDDRAHAAIATAPIAMSVPLLVVGMLLLSRSDSLLVQVAGAVAIAAYLPRSHTDWQPVVDGAAQLLK